MIHKRAIFAVMFLSATLWGDTGADIELSRDSLSIDTARALADPDTSLPDTLALDTIEAFRRPAEDSSLAAGANSADSSDAAPAPRPDHANDAADSALVDLDKMVVTATRTRRRLSEIPAAVSVIDRSEIEVSPAKNVDDLLMTEPSVQVKRVVGMGEGIPSDIMIRGIPGALAATRTLILVDGIPTNVSGTPFLILNELPLRAVERVEVVRGPFSSLYGANAFGGVINIITRDGVGRPSVEGYLETSYPFSLLHEYARDNGPSGIDLHVTSGARALWHGGLLSEGELGRFHYLASGGYRAIGNYLVADSALVRKDSITAYKDPANHDYEDVRVFAKLGASIGEKTRVTVHGRFFDSELGFGKTRNITPDPVDIRTTGRKILLGPQARIAVSELMDLYLGSYYRHVKGGFWSEAQTRVGGQTVSTPTYWRSASNDVQFEGRATMAFGWMSTLTGGFDYLYNTIDFGPTLDIVRGDTIIDGAEARINNFGIFLQDEILVFDKLQLVPGIRVDYHSDFGAAWSPKFSIGYTVIDEIRLKGSVGRAFRAPSLSELYMPDMPLRIDYRLRSNPSLEPEYVWSVDGAFEARLIEKWRIVIGGFYNRMSNLILPGVDISQFSDDDEVYPVTHRNASDAWSQGFELESEYEATSWLSVQANYTFQDSRDESMRDVRDQFYTWGFIGPEDTGAVTLDYIPRHAAGAGLRFQKGYGRFSFRGSLDQTIVGARSYLDWTGVSQDEVQFNLETNEILINPHQVRLDNYWRTDIGLTAELDGRYWLRFNVQNLFGAEIEEHGGTLAPRRFATLEIGARY
jgi:outer membrane receptor for ferrienterochelin and colicins